jgi:hypothetical protein
LSKEFSLILERLSLEEVAVRLDGAPVQGASDYVLEERNNEHVVAHVVASGSEGKKDVIQA